MHVTKKKIWWMLLSALTLSFVLVIGSLGLAAGRSGTAQAHSSKTSAAESSSSGYVLGAFSCSVSAVGHAPIHAVCL